MVETMRGIGYDVNVVKRNLGSEQGRTADAYVEGFGRLDEISPQALSGSNPFKRSQSIVNGVDGKLSNTGAGQADSVFVNLPDNASKADAYMAAVRIFFGDKGDQLKSLIFRQPDGTVFMLDKNLVTALRPPRR
jgi:hypothetical protein